MKKSLALTGLITGTFFFLMILFPTSQVIGSDEKPGITPSASMPDSILKIVQRACMDCHANDGSAMARSKLNFSKWEEYSPEKMAKKARAMCKEVKAGDMPTKGWRKNNPDAIPTQAEVDAICAWAASLNKP